MCCVSVLCLCLCVLLWLCCRPIARMTRPSLSSVCWGSVLSKAKSNTERATCRMLFATSRKRPGTRLCIFSGAKQNRSQDNMRLFTRAWYWNVLFTDLLFSWLFGRSLHKKLENKTKIRNKNRKHKHFWENTKMQMNKKISKIIKWTCFCSF